MAKASVTGDHVEPVHPSWRRGTPSQAGVPPHGVDPSFVITHRVPLDQAPGMYKTFRDKEEGCIKVVVKPNG